MISVVNADRDIINLGLQREIRKKHMLYEGPLQFVHASTAQISVIVGGFVAGLVVVIGLVIVTFWLVIKCFRDRRKKRKREPLHTGVSNERTSLTNSRTGSATSARSTGSFKKV